MEITHIQKYIHTTPRKLRLVADMVRKMNPSDALTVLKFTRKAAAKDLAEALKVALANARMGGLNQVSLKSIEINEGPKMRRFRAGTRGRVKPFKRRMGHIKIVLTDDLKIKNQISKIKNEKKEKAVEEKEERK